MLRKEDSDEGRDATIQVDGQNIVEDDEEVDDNQTVLSRVKLARTVSKSLLSPSHACHWQLNE
jgi:hypothetical protein